MAFGENKDFKLFKYVNNVHSLNPVEIEIQKMTDEFNRINKKE
ncbi:hypothetical protein ACIQYS_04945 [Psychrobacillus sp. NPDC096426]